jgi:hypothetical protein
MTYIILMNIGENMDTHFPYIPDDPSIYEDYDRAVKNLQEEVSYAADFEGETISGQIFSIIPVSEIVTYSPDNV